VIQRIRLETALSFDSRSDPFGVPIGIRERVDSTEKLAQEASAQHHPESDCWVVGKHLLVTFENPRCSSFFRRC